MSQITTFLGMRKKMIALGERLSAEEAHRIPRGFKNNVVWNLGHVLVTHQILCYKLSGLPMLVDGDMIARFAKGTRPEDWEEPADLSAVLTQLLPLGEKFVNDYAAGVFKEFEPYTTSTGFTLENIDDAFSFNLAHEGLHLGYALAQRRAAN